MKLFIVSLVLGVPILLTSQVKIDANSLLLIEEIKQAYTNNPEDKAALVQKYPVRYLKGEYYLISSARVSQGFDSNALPEGFFSGSKIGSIVSIYVSIDKLEDIDRLEHVEQLEAVTQGSWFMKDIITEVRADSVHNGYIGNTSFKGKDIIIGLPETGIDFTHPVFYDSILTNQRIMAAWDQRRVGGNKPVQGYGAEYTTDSELLLAGSDTFDMLYSAAGGYGTHGTGTGSMAAAGGAGKSYFGAAPESDLLFAAIDLYPANILDAWSWMMQKAKAEAKPLVISMSFGGYHWGPLDGTSNLSVALDAMVDSGVVAVVSTSNSGFIDYHLKKDYQMDTIRTKVDINSYANRPTLYGARLIMWGEAGHNFDYWLEVYNAGALVMKTPMMNTGSAVSGTGFIHMGTDTVHYILANDAAHPSNGAPHVNMRLKNKNTAWDIVLGSSADSGTVHYYNFDVYDGDITRNAATLVQWNGNGYGGNPEYGHPDPAVATKAITTGGYYNMGAMAGQKDDYAPLGPTIDGRTKPDIMSVSREVTVAISSFNTFGIPAVDNVIFNSKTYEFATAIQGNSYTSPVVAGVAALMMEANPSLSPTQIKDSLRATARQDAFTGNIPITGSNMWGWGKLNASAAVRSVLDTSSSISNEEWTIFESSLVSVYPNPSRDFLNIEGLARHSYEYEVIDVSGRVIFAGSSEDNKIDLQYLQKGVYTLVIKARSDSWSARFVKI